jgi:hypothetical protein
MHLVGDTTTEKSACRGVRSGRGPVASTGMKVRLGTGLDGAPVSIDTPSTSVLALLGDQARGKTTITPYLARWVIADPLRAAPTLAEQPHQYADLAMEVRRLAEAETRVEAVDVALADDPRRRRQSGHRDGASPRARAGADDPHLFPRGSAGLGWHRPLLPGPPCTRSGALPHQLPSGGERAGTAVVDHPSEHGHQHAHP